MFISLISLMAIVLSIGHVMIWRTINTRESQALCLTLIISGLLLSLSNFVGIVLLLGVSGAFQTLDEMFHAGPLGWFGFIAAAFLAAVPLAYGMMFRRYQLYPLPVKRQDEHFVRGRLLGDYAS